MLFIKAKGRTYAFNYFIDIFLLQWLHHQMEMSLYRLYRYTRNTHTHGLWKVNIIRLSVWHLGKIIQLHRKLLVLILTNIVQDGWTYVILTNMLNNIVVNRVHSVNNINYLIISFHQPLNVRHCWYSMITLITFHFVPVLFIHLFQLLLCVFGRLETNFLYIQDWQLLQF